MNGHRGTPPDIDHVATRGYRMLAFEDLVANLIRESAVFATMEDAALEARRRLFS